MARLSRLVVPAAIAAALLAAPSPAAARSPSAAEQGSLEWILQKLKKDREQDQTTRQVTDPVRGYQDGEVPLEDWKSLADKISDRSGKTSNSERDRCVSAIIFRFRAEDAQGKTDPKVVDATKRALCLELLGLMISNDENGRIYMHRLSLALVPNSGVRWSPGDNPQRRAKAYSELKTWLKRPPK